MKWFLLSIGLCLADIIASAQNGKVGINTSTPLAGLHVVDSSVLFSTAGRPDNTSGLPAPINGEGRRMMWWPARAAFRAGYVEGNNWNKDSIGLYSFAGGYDTKAKGEYSTAFGLGTSASSSYAFAAGGYAKASGTVSIAMGSGVTASGYVSVAMGDGSLASGDNSTAIGYDDTAAGRFSAALGTALLAPSYGELAVGLFNERYTPVSTGAVSYNDRVFSVGNGYSYANRSNALTIMKDGRIGIGVSAPFSWLSNTTKNTIGADGAGGNPGSFAWSANQLGYSAQIYNESNSPIANGLAVKVLNSNAMALDVSYGTQESPGYPLFNVRANGNVGVGTNLPAFKVDVVGRTARQAMRLSSGRGQTDNDGILVIQDSSNNTAASPNNELISFVNAQGNVIGTISRVANANSIAFNTTSDTRLKTNIQPTRYGLQNLLAIQVADYQYKGFANASPQTGFLAQQLYQVYPEAVTKGNDANEREPYLVDYSKLTPLLVKALQEVNSKVEDLQQQVKTLQQQNEALQADSRKYEAVLDQLKELQQAVKTLRQ